MADEKDFAKELNTLITRYIEGAATLRTLLTNYCETQTPYSGTTTPIYLVAKPPRG